MCRDDCVLLFLTYLWSWTPLWVAEARQQTCAHHWPAAWCSLGRRRGRLGCPSSPNRSWRPWQVLLNSCWSWRVGKYPERVWFHHHHHHRPILRQNFGAAWQQACLYGPVALGPGAWCPSDQLRSQTKNSTPAGMKNTPQREKVSNPEEWNYNKMTLQSFSTASIQPHVKSGRT